MPFNSLDKALLDRAVRRTSQDAVDHKASVTINGIWPNTPDGRRDKRLYDALNRDAGDLKALQQRMMREVGDASVVPKPRGPKVPLLEEVPAPQIPSDIAGVFGPALTGGIFGGMDWKADAAAIAGELREDPGAPLLGVAARG